MSYIIQFLSCPVVFAFQAYQSAHFEYSLEKECHPLGWYFHTLSSLSGNRVKEKIQSFLDEEKIRKDLIVVETPNPGGCAAKGTNLFRKGDAVVMLAPGLHDKDKEACHWVMKHEISHIKNNDLFTMPLVGSFFSTAAAIFGTLTMPCVFSTILTATVGLTAFSLFSQWREGKADDFAIENSSKDELLGGRRYLIALQQMYLDQRQTFLGKIVVSSYGNNTFDILHPSLTSRIEKIERVLEKRGIVVDKEGETQKIESLK